MARNTTVGALKGWERTPSEHGTIITLWILTPEAAQSDNEADKVSMALNDRQIRSLARDLARAASDRSITLQADTRWWRRFLY